MYLLKSFSAGLRGVQSKERGNQQAASATSFPCAFQIFPFSTAQSQTPRRPFLQPSRSHHKSNMRAVRFITGWCMMSPGKHVGSSRIRGRPSKILAFRIPVSRRRLLYSAFVGDVRTEFRLFLYLSVSTGLIS